MAGMNRTLQVVKAVGATFCRAAPRPRLPGARHIHTSGVLTKDAAFSRFPVPTVDELPADLQEQHKLLMANPGFVPNVISAWAYRPDEMKAFLHFHDIVMQERGNLSAVDKEMIVVVTSAENSCMYCVVHRSAMLRLHSKDPYLADQLAVNWKTAQIDDRQRAILDFAITVCHCRPISEDQFDALEKHGLTRDDAWDIGAVTALFAVSNRMANVMDLKPNTEFYSMGRDQTPSD